MSQRYHGYRSCFEFPVWFVVRSKWVVSCGIELAVWGEYCEIMKFFQDLSYMNWEVSCADQRIRLLEPINKKTLHPKKQNPFVPFPGAIREVTSVSTFLFQYRYIGPV